MRRLLAEIAPDTGSTDLGGEDSLNLLLHGHDVVLRIHKPIDSAERILAERSVRRHLADAGLTVPAPIRWQGQDLLRCGERWAELEQYVAPAPGPPTQTDAWLFEAVGRLHRVLGLMADAPPAPVARTAVSPTTLARWLARNRADGHPLFADDRRVAQISALIRMLRRRWTPAYALPRQLIHGDLHPGNILHTGSGEPLYLDLGGVQVAPRVADLGYLFAHLLSRNGPDPATFDWEGVPTLLRAYGVAAHKPLDDAERQALPARIAAVATYIDVCDWAPTPWQHIASWLLEHPDVLRG